ARRRRAGRVHVRQRPQGGAGRRRRAGAPRQDRRIRDARRARALSRGRGRAREAAARAVPRLDGARLRGPVAARDGDRGRPLRRAGLMSLLTDELKSWIGREAHYSAHEELGRASIRYFALALGDDDRLYVDDGYAREAGYPSLIAPPTLVCET